VLFGRKIGHLATVNLMNANGLLAFLNEALTQSGINLDQVVAERGDIGSASQFIGECVLWIQRSSIKFPIPHVVEKMHMLSSHILKALEARIQSGCVSFLFSEVFASTARRFEEESSGVLNTLTREVLRSFFLILSLL
jgi:hypothetical protein